MKSVSEIKNDFKILGIYHEIYLNLSITKESKPYEFSFDKISKNLQKDNVITFFNKNKNTYSSYLASSENIIEEEDSWSMLGYAIDKRITYYKDEWIKYPSENFDRMVRLKKLELI